MDAIKLKSKTVDVQKLCVGALLIAVGVLLPQIFHLIGGPAAGGLFLPMHIPVLLAGLLLGPYFGAVVGVLSPVISFLTMGMPPAARLPFMLLELCAYGLLSGLFYKKRVPLYLSLILAQIGGRAVYALSLLAASSLLELNAPPVLTAWTAVVTGIPGIAVQLIFIPPIVVLLKKVIHFDRDTQKLPRASQK